MIDFVLFRDAPLRSQPKGTTPDVRNMVKSKLLQAWVSEPGFDVWSQYLSNHNLVPVGIAAVNNGRKVVLSVAEDTLSEIGTFDASGTYTSILHEDIGFDVDHPMDIEYEYNTQGQLIIAFTDNLNTPKVLNIDSPPSPFDVSRIEMFPSSSEIKIISDVIDNGGNLLSGAYYSIFKYRNNDLSESGWSEPGNPVYVVASNSNSSFSNYEGSPAGVITGKSIQFTVSNLDNSYDKIVLGIVYKNNGVITCYELGEQILSSEPMSINLTDVEQSGTVIDLAVILTPLAFYNRIHHLTQTNGVLYAADVSEPDLVNLQQYTNLIQLQWHSQLTNPKSLLSSYKLNDQNNKKKGFLHEEVYAFYTRYKKKKGGWTDWFHTPGRGVATVDGQSFNDDVPLSTLVLTDASYQVDITIDGNSKYFQTRDTTNTLSSITGVGNFGYWANEDEVYPSLDMFNSSGIGGEDLRGKPVRHFRFPTIRKLKDSFYSSAIGYGNYILDELSIQISTFPTIPDEFGIEGFELGYAKRNASNSTVAGQDIIVCGAYRQADTGPLNTRTSWSSSGNWNNRDTGEDSDNAKEDLEYNPNYFRFHSFDLLLNKPAIEASYTSNQFTLLRSRINTNHAIQNGPQQWVYHIDFTDTSDTSCTSIENSDEVLFAIKDFKYIPNNSIVGKINNLNCEACAWAELVYGNNRILGEDNGMPFGGTVSTLPQERVYFTNIMNYKKNIYTNFYSQSLASTGTYFLLSDDFIGQDIYGGDTFISEYGFVTYGPRTTRDTPGSPFPYVEPINYTDWGVKVVRSFLCESYNNIGFRYESLSNQYSRYYPKEVVGSNIAWFLGYDIRQDWNIILYNSDYSSVNDIGAYNSFNPFALFIDQHPNRIIRCVPSPNEQRAISWRTFLANDYFEIQRNRGAITNIQGTAENYIFINTQYSLFKTVGTEQLQTNEFQVVLGTGDIFGRPPTESDNDEHGYAGCQNKYSCLLTPYGYFFADAEKKRFFLTGKNLEVTDITYGLVNDFQSLMLNEGDNPYQNLGYVSAWDQRFERLLISQVGTTNPFTYSFDPKEKLWVAEHDYIPSFLFNDRAGIYSLDTNYNIYRHNSVNNQIANGQFYGGAIYESYYVHVFNSARPEYPYGQGYKPDSITKKQETFFNVSWKTDSIMETVKLRNRTVDSLLVWNSYQCSGDIDIIPLDLNKTLTEQYDIYNTRRVKDIWMFNKFRDAVISEASPFVIKSQAIGGNIDQNQDFTLKKRLSDDYLAVKFLFSNEKSGILSVESHLIDVAVNYNPVVR